MSPVSHLGKVIVLFNVLTSLVHVLSLEFYTNQWAVEVKGGEDVAEEIAQKHGFTNLGQIGSLKNHYLFEHEKVFKRSVESSIHHHTRLKRESRVLWSEQQIIKKRTKREFASTDITDPLWSDQWYLHGGSSNGYDMNVLPAWKKGVTGKGVVVTILDDGIERDHPDLVDNYDPEASIDINGADNDPMPRPTGSNENRHGTRCAGEVAAGLNSYCGIGVAYHSKIGGVRMLDGDVTDAVEAKSLSFHPQHVDIYSASWGPDDDGKVVDGPGPLAKKAFVDGVEMGRGGKGSIFVWASGNGGSMKDSCSCDGYSNSIYTLSISSTSEHGRKPWYLEECASTLATTYSSGENYREKQIVTTDLKGKCTRQHTGTSASAPLAAGLLALALEVNGNLTWRDTQYIVLMTSRPEPMVDGNFILNGVGRKVSHRYGYGLMDADGMVTLAKQWKTVPEKFICEEPVIKVSQDITRKLIVNITSTGCAGQANAVRFLEHVQLKVTLQFPHRGDAEINLISPSKTRSNLLPRRQNDYNHGSFNNWPFLSVFFWGENPTGNWTAEFVNSGYEKNAGVLESYQLILHGTKTDPLHPTTAMPTVSTTVTYAKTSATTTTTTTTTTTIADTTSQQLPEKGTKPVDISSIEDENETTDNSDESTWWIFGKSKPKNKCHTECEGGCNGTGAEDCTSCKHFKLDGACVPSCPADGFVINTDGSKVCTANSDCHPTCRTCSGPLDTECLSCPDNHYLNEVFSSCVASCSLGSYADVNNVCKECSLTCLGCAESPDHCILCKEDQTLLGGSCVAKCAPGEYLSVNGCVACSAYCANCTGLGDGWCMECSNNTFIMNGSCVMDCNVDGFYADNHSDVWTCRSCHPSCKSCSGSNITDCLRCADNHTLSDGLCVFTNTSTSHTEAVSSECPPSQYKDAFDDCVPCHETCSACHGVSSWDCTQCADNRVIHRGQCLETCPDSYYESSEPTTEGVIVHQCKECHVTCKTCSGEGPNECLSCLGSVALVNGLCESESTIDQSACPAGSYRDVDSLCLPCHSSCSECSGSLDDQCTECESAFFLHEGKCIEGCPDNYYGNNEGRCQACDSTCWTCSGGTSGDCTSCNEVRRLDHGQCQPIPAHSCPTGTYVNSLQQSCDPCDVSCLKCNGASSAQCTECDDHSMLQNGECISQSPEEVRDSGEQPHSTNPPMQTQKPKPPEDNEFINDNLDERENWTHTDDERTHNSEEHPRIRTAATTNVERHFNLEDPPLREEVDKSELGFHYKTVGVVVALCVIATVVFFVVFGVLQARSHEKWCFRSVGYQKVPTLYDRTNDRILLSAQDFDDEDEIF